MGTPAVTDGIGQYYESKVASHGHAGVNADLLFTHKGAPTREDQFQTTYDQANAIVHPPRRPSRLQEKQAQWAKEQATYSRAGTYQTEFSDNHNIQSSTINMQKDPDAKNYAFKGELTNTFSQPHRKLRLRQD